MADYKSILKKTISGLPSNTAETRKLVYAKARTAIDKQLRSINPPPSETAIAGQMDLLEKAIDSLEAEYDPPTPAQPAAPPPPPAEQSPVAPAPAVSSAQAFPSASSAMQPPQPFETIEAPTPNPSLLSPGPTVPSAAGPGGPPAYDASLDSLANVQEPVSVGGRRPVLQDQERKSSWFAKALVSILIVAVLAGGAYALWLNREPLLALLESDEGANGTAIVQEQNDGQEEPASVTADQQAAVSEDDANKEVARLGENGETIDRPAVRNVTPSTDDAPGSGESRLLEDGQAETPEVNPVDESGAEVAADTQADDSSSNVPIVGQKAFLYEEGLGSAAASQDIASVVWSVDQEAPAEGLPEEPVIKGQLDVPGRGLTMNMTVKRNVDEALSASHIIELVFDAPPDFSGGNIDTLARFVMKSNEQARGEPLVAVPVKINSGFFMIALNNLEQARESNKRLLLDSNWIDIPLGYSTGRRALITLEKGATGNQAFREAFDDWDNR